MKERVRRWAWPGGILLGALVLRLIFFTGLQGEDDILYSAAAHGLSRGALDSGVGVLGMRLGVVGPMALLYAVAGANSASLAALNLASSLVLVFLAYRFGRELYSETEGRWAAVFVGLLPLDVFHSTEVHADLPQAALAAGAIYLAWNALRRESGRPAILLCLAAGLFFGWAHLAKESAFLLPLALLPWARERRAWGRLAAVGLSFGVVILAEVVFYGATRGDFLHRVHAAQQIQDSGPAPGFGERGAGLLGLLFNPLGVNFPYTGGLFVLAAAGLGWAIVRDRATSGWVAFWAGGTLLLLAFWPVSLVPYKAAMTLRPRILAPIEVPAALLAARFVARGLLAWRLRLAGLGLAAFAGLALLSIVRLHQDGARFRNGVEWAHGILAKEPGARVVADGRTVAMLNFLSAYRPAFEARAYRTDDPPPGRGTLLFDDPFRVWIHESWAGVSPPPWFRASSPPRDVVAERLFAAPRRLRGASGPPRRVVVSRLR